MSKLPEDDVELFYRLMHALLYYVNKKFNIIKNIDVKEDFFKRDIQETIPLRNKIYKNPQVFDDFVRDNSENFNKDELDIILSWKKFKQGEFFLVKHAKEYSVLYDEKEKKAYGVLCISDSFEDMFGNHIPILMRIVLIPFKEKIIYKGIFVSYNIHFGGEIKKSIYWKEINKLKAKSNELEAVHHQELAKHYARAIKKNLKTVGIKGYFAVLGESVVASATSNKKLEDNLMDVVPIDKIGWLY